MVERLADTLTSRVRHLLPTFFLLVVAFRTGQVGSRGLDYLLGNPTPGTGVFNVSDSMPPIVWGATSLAAAIAAAVGLVFGRVAVLRNAAVVAACVYVAFACVIFDDVFMKGAPDDWRFFTDYLSAAGAWAAIAWLMTIQLAVIRERPEGEVKNGDQ